jgi:hypothetical protein
MIAHTKDASVHFTGMITKLAELSDEIKNLKNDDIRSLWLSTDVDTLKDEIVSMKTNMTLENDKLKRESSDGIVLLWTILNFHTARNVFISSDSNVFGHVTCLRLQRTNECSHYGLYLGIRSRKPCRFGCKFTIGRCNGGENSQHAISWSSPGLIDYPSVDGHWGQGCVTLAAVADLTREKLLTTEGSLQIKAIIYRVMPFAEHSEPEVIGCHLECL